MLYRASSINASLVPTVVATGTALKTVLQLLVPATTTIKIWGWGISFDGVTATAVPGLVSLLSVTNATAAAVTSTTPQIWSSPNTIPLSLCVGGATATGYNASGEGTTLSAQRFFDSQLVHPQTGYSVWFPSDARPPVPVSKSVRIRTTFAATVNCIPWIVYEEAA